MKRLLFLAFAACTSNQAPPKKPIEPAAPPPASECQVVASHIADTVMAMKDAPKGIDRSTIASVVSTHCERDGWSADAKKCLAVMTEQTADDCGKMLSDDQNDKLMKDMLAHLPKDASDGGGADDPPPPPADSGDPCEGGE